MSTNAVWEEKSTIGDIGEKWFEDFMTKQMGFTTIPIGKDDFLGIQMKMDFICYKPKSDKNKELVTRWEVKTCTRISETGNMFVECFDDRAKLSLGWFNTTKANHICYIDYKQELMYFFELKSLTEYVNTHSLRKASCYDKASDGSDRTIEREGYLVNVDRFKAWCKTNKKWFTVRKVKKEKDIEVA